MENRWPEFVSEEGDDNPARPPGARGLTGWETVVFEVMDDQETGGSDFSTAAMAP